MIGSIMQIEYEISEQDFLNAQKLAVRKAPKLGTRLLFRILPFWGVLLFLGVAWPVFRKGFILKTEMLVPFSFAVLCLGSPLLLKRAYQKAYRRNPSYQGKRSLILNENGLALSGDTFSSQLKWEHFIRFVEDEKVLLLYQGSQVVQIVPKRQLSQEEILELKEAFTRHIASKR
ncbi:MAG: YcxB family protein [Candidatus Angelobacter sp.]